VINVSDRSAPSEPMAMFPAAGGRSSPSTFLFQRHTPGMPANTETNRCSRIVLELAGYLRLLYAFPAHINVASAHHQ
jgi:hypothetical protein